MTEQPALEIDIESLLQKNGNGSREGFIEAAQNLIREQSESHRKRQEARDRAEAERVANWRESTRNYAQEQQEALRFEWISYHRSQIARLTETRDTLIAKHEQAIARLEGLSSNGKT